MSNNVHNNLWDQYERAALVARKQGNWPKSARILKEAFKEAEEYGEIYPGLVKAAHGLADFHMNNYRFEEAESLYRLVLEVREKLLGQTHDDVVDSLKKVAIVQIMAFRAEALGTRVVRSTPPLFPEAISYQEPIPYQESIAYAS